jgi:nucleotide-binding universal stress UspA family protein
MKYSNIVIAVDGSEFSENAAKKGMELAKQLSASVTLLSVIDISTMVNNSAGGIISPELLTIYTEQAHTTVDSIAEKYPYSKINKVTEEGLPGETVLKIAHRIKADMIIMGTHGRKGLNHLIMGSVAEYVIRRSNIPVMVVPKHQ